MTDDAALYDLLTPHERQAFDEGTPEFREELRREMQRFISEAHAFVEDYWKGFLEIVAVRGQEAALEYTHRFNDVTQRAADQLGDGRTRYLAMIEAERERLFEEYNRDPDAQKRRLGVPIPLSGPEPAHRPRQNMPIGQLAVRTAVRATVWTLVRDAIRAIVR